MSGCRAICSVYGFHVFDCPSRSLAPDYDVPENVSPFKQLPLLKRCRSCRQPIEPLEEMTAVRNGVAYPGLCPTRAPLSRPAKSGEGEQ